MNGKIKKSGRVVWAVFVTLALLVQMLAPAAAYASGGGDFGGGTGTESEPYIISSEAHLQEMAAKLNDPATYADFGSAWYVLSGDITMTPPAPDGSNHTPIGTAIYQFTGNFDGQLHTVSGLVYKNSSGAGANYGLFGYVGTGGAVRNTRIASSSIEGDSNVGGIAGYNQGIITGCSFAGSVKGSAANVGGIAGDNAGEISGSSFDGTVSSSSFAVGGIAGRSAGTVKTSNFRGTVTGGWVIGGIVGDNSGEINSCSNDGNVTGTHNNIGGVAGDNRAAGIIRYSGNYGDIYGTFQIGGVAGRNRGLIEHSRNMGNVSANRNDGLAGGIAGQSWDGTIQYCYNQGAVNGENYVGGLVGINGTDIKDSYNLGGVTGLNDVGGLVGSLYEGSITRSYAAGAVTGTGARVGGLLGDNYNNGTTITGSCYDSEITGRSDTGKGEPKTTAEMKTQATFADWDFTSIWAIVNTATHWSYPYLRWIGFTEAEAPGYSLKPQNGAPPAPEPEPGSGSGSGAGSAPTPWTPIMINGQIERQAATASTQNQDGKTGTAVTLVTQKTAALLNAASTGSTVTIPVNNAADDAAAVQLSGDLVKAMESRETLIEIKTNNAGYTLPARQINIEAVLAKLGQDVKLSDVKLNVEIAETTGEMARIAEDTASKGNFAIVVQPLSFTVKITYGDKTLDVSKFDSYVERTMAIPDGVDSAKITTAVIFDRDGAVRHVPTQVIVIDGKYYAKINSLTNSIYSLIWNPVQFKDVEGHWAKEAVNDMGSRLVISGVGNNMFVPDRDITRAEFAAIMIRALGLKPGKGDNPFTDVSNTAWYCDYIKTAAEYKIISGYGDGRFGPDDKITREQAMAIAARAMSITGLEVEFANGEREKLLANFGDAKRAADYARNSIAACIKTGIVSGRGGNLIAPKDNINRAEVAVIVRGLLRKSDLI